MGQVNNEVVSIEIGSQNTKLVIGKYKGNQVHIKKMVTTATPPSSYKDGRILDKDRLKNAILNALGKEKLHNKLCVCTMNSTLLITREVTLPFVANEQDMGKMVMYEIEQYFPVSLSDYAIEYKVMEKFEEENMLKARLLVAALPKIIAYEYLNIIKELKMKPMAMDIHSNAIGKLFCNTIDINGSPYSPKGATAIIDMGYSFSNVNIISDNCFQLSRLVPLGGKNVDQDIANLFNLTPELAEEKKIKEAKLMAVSDQLSEFSMFNDEVKNSLSNWMAEFQRIFQYYLSRKTGNAIDKIYVFGGSARFNELAHFMRASLGIPVEIIQRMSNIRFEKVELNAKPDITGYLNVLGAIIRQ